jgi:hypothetical protein
MVVLPAARPEVRPETLIVAATTLEEVHVAELETFCVEPSEYVARAVYCSMLPAVSDAFRGVTAIDARVTGTIGAVVTVSVVELETELSCASIVVLPGRIAVARPAGLMIAISEFEEDHVTMPETS